MTPWVIVLTLVLLLANAYFVAVEFALVASRGARLEELPNPEGLTGRLSLAAVGDINAQLAGSQLGITMMSLGLGFVAEPALAFYLEGPIEAMGVVSAGAVHGLSFALALTVVVFAHMVLGEMVPKNLAIAGPEHTLRALIVPYRAYMFLFAPVIKALNLLSIAGSRVLGVEPAHELIHIHTPEEFEVLIEQSAGEGLIEEFETDLLRGALRFERRHVRERMIPRSEMAILDGDTTPEAAEQIVLDRGHSRFPVADREDPGRLRGFIHAKDLLTLSSLAYTRPIPDRLLRPLIRVGPEATLAEVMRRMRRERIHIAVVVEDNETIGLITLEDLLESLVGDIKDEYDRH